MLTHFIFRIHYSLLHIPQFVFTIPYLLFLITYSISTIAYSRFRSSYVIFHCFLFYAFKPMGWLRRSLILTTISETGKFTGPTANAIWLASRNPPEHACLTYLVILSTTSLSESDTNSCPLLVPMRLALLLNSSC